MPDLCDYLNDLFNGIDKQHIWLAGGIVRDLLLKRHRSDIDLVAVMSPEEISSRGFRLVSGKSTVPIWFRHDDAVGTIEVTLIADETDLIADLSRRDFTVNAMAMTLDGDIIDPLNGKADLDGRLLRACSPQTFNMDPIRIFRALRFETDGWRMDHNTETLIRCRDWSGAWADIPVERFSREMIKAMQGYIPEQFFQQTLNLNVSTCCIPEVSRMPDIPAGPLIHHPEGDLFTHSIQVLQRASEVSKDPLTRFCALFHDIGKLATSPDLYPKHHGHDLAGFDMALEFCRRLRLPAQYGTALAWISRLHGTFNLWDQLRDATKLKIAGQAIKAGVVDILPIVAAADKAGGSEPDEWRRVVAIADLSATELGIDPEHLEQIAPKKRADVIMQKRLEMFKTIQTSCS
jgi:tRNA nucleotidyltransferase (CCA-adding enzyme)